MQVRLTNTYKVMSSGGNQDIDWKAWEGDTESLLGA